MRSVARALYVRSLSSICGDVRPSTASASFISHRANLCIESNSERSGAETGADSDADGEKHIRSLLERLRRVPRNQSLVPMLQSWIEAGNKIGPFEMKIAFGRLEWKNKYEQALEVVEWLLKEKPFELVERHYARWITYLGKVYGYEKAQRAFEVIPSEFQKEVVYCRLFDVLLDCNRVGGAKDVIKRMTGQKLAVPVYMCNKLISYCDKNSMQNKIPALLKVMEEKNIPYNLQTYNILLAFSSRQSDVQHMEHIWACLQADNTVKPDFVSYSTLASAYFFAGQHEKALSAAQNAEKDLTSKSTTTLKLKKLVALYGSLKQGQDVRFVYQKLESMPGETSISSYMCVIEAYGEAGLVDSAEKVMKKMKVQKGLHHLCQYNTMLGVYCKHGNMEKAHKVFKKLTTNHKPDMFTYSYMLLGYLKSEQLQQAWATLENVVTLAKDVTISRNFCMSRPWLLNMSNIIGLLAEKGYKKQAETLLTALQEAEFEQFSTSNQFLRKAYEQSLRSLAGQS